MLFFFLPIVVAFTLTYAATKVFLPRIGRARLPRVTGLSTFVIANVTFWGMNTLVSTSPLGTESSRFQLWLFAFLPISVVFAFVLMTFVNHLHENDDEKRM